MSLIADDKQEAKKKQPQLIKCEVFFYMAVFCKRDVKQTAVCCAKRKMFIYVSLIYFITFFLFSFLYLKFARGSF